MTHKRLLLKIDHQDKQTTKSSIIALTCIILLFGIISILFANAGLVSSSVIILLGISVYVATLMYEIQGLIEQRIRNKKEIKILHVTSTLIYAGMIYLILLLIILFNSLRQGLLQNERIIAILTVPLIIIPLTIWDELITIIKKTIKKKALNKKALLLFSLALFLTPVTVEALTNSTVQDTIETVNLIQKATGILENLTNQTGGILGFVNEQRIKIGDALGLSEIQTWIILGIMFIVSVIIAIKFIGSVLKWILLLLVVLLIVMLLT